MIKVPYEASLLIAEKSTSNGWALARTTPDAPPVCQITPRLYSYLNSSRYTHIKGGRSQPNPFGFIVQTRMVMHVLTIFTRASKMACTNKVFEKQSKIFLDICGLVVHQGCPSHIMSMPFIKRPYTFGTPRATNGITNKLSLLKEKGKYLTFHISKLSTSMEAISDFDLFPNFVNFNASPILKIIDEG